MGGVNTRGLSHAKQLVLTVSVERASPPHPASTRTADSHHHLASPIRAEPDPGFPQLLASKTIVFELTRCPGPSAAEGAVGIRRKFAAHRLHQLPLRFT